MRSSAKEQNVAANTVTIPNFSVDHLYPRSLGGTDDLINRALAVAATTNDDTTSSPELTHSLTKKPNSSIPDNIHGPSISFGHLMEYI